MTAETDLEAIRRYVEYHGPRDELRAGSPFLATLIHTCRLAVQEWPTSMKHERPKRMDNP